MTQPKTTRIPAPLYAAAGAGDLAFQQLRKLPDRGDRPGRQGSVAEPRVAEGRRDRQSSCAQKATETLRTANLTADRACARRPSRPS